MSKEGKTGVSSTTPEKILFGAGTIHKNLTYSSTSSSWNFADSLYGATNGGSKLTIKPEVTPIELDGALVATKGLEVKTGGVAEMEINFAEITTDIIKASTLGKSGTSADSNFSVIEDKADIAEGDYWDNIAFVGRTVTGKKIIAILENALCTSGMELNPQNKTQANGVYTFACHAELDDDLDSLPWHIYYPTT